MAASFLRDVVAGAVVLGILVLVHEWGHFIVAKLCGVRVEVFSIGFGRRLAGVKHGDTDYRISALPLGGYVRMSGDNPVEERTGAPYEFLSRPRWQRFLIAVAGPASNILAAFLILWGIFAFAGMPEEAIFRQPADVVAVPETYAGTSPIRPGDRIVEVNGAPTPTWDDVSAQLANVKPGQTVSLAVLRAGAKETFSLTIPQAQSSSDEGIVGYPLIPPVIGEVSPSSPAEKAGLKAGDTVASVNGQPVVTWPQLVSQIRGSGGRPVEFLVRRDGRDVRLDITPMQSMTPDGEMVWMIGASDDAKEVYVRQGLVASLEDAWDRTLRTVRSIGTVFTALFSGKLSVRDVAGPVGIVQLSGHAAQGGLLSLLEWMAFISLNLGLMNLLPIPILDGGHVLMLAIEGVLRRDMSVTFKERFVQVGLVFLLGLFAFVMYSDLLRLFQRH